MMIIYDHKYHDNTIVSVVFLCGALMARNRAQGGRRITTHAINHHTSGQLIACHGAGAGTAPPHLLAPPPHTHLQRVLSSPEHHKVVAQQVVL